MAGKKGMKGWNKREEYDWRELIAENKTILLKLAKKFRVDMEDLDDEKIEAIMEDPNRRKLFFKSLDIASAVVVKSMPTTLQGAGDSGEFVIKVEVEGKSEDKGISKPSNRIGEYFEV